MTTIKDIAQESGYGVGTVSRVLNNKPGVSSKARAEIMEVVERNRFRVNGNARNLKQQDSNSIAVIIKGMQNMLFTAVLESLQRGIGDHGFDCLIFYLSEQEDEVELAHQVCLERHPRGILFLGSDLGHFRDGFEGVDVPAVLVTNSAEDLGFSNLSSVATDDAAAAETAIDYLVSLGHTRIGVLGGIIQISRPAGVRLDGCLRAFEKHGIDFSPERQYESALFTMETGYDAMERLLDKAGDITAVFCMADVMAVGAIRALNDRGLRVPEDVSVMGFDGIDLGSYLSPRLSTICQDRERIAERSLEVLLSQMEAPTDPIFETVPFKIATGESTTQI